MTKIYIDTEFNEFEGDLISMALVAEDGEEFYEVLECLDPKPWVTKHVMPILEKDAIPYDQFQRKLENYLMQYQEVTIIADWPDDFKYFCQTLITGPGYRIRTPKVINMRIDSALSNGDSKVLHNALHDARAIMESDLEKLI